MNIIYAKIVLAGVEQGAQLVSLVSNKLWLMVTGEDHFLESKKPMGLRPRK